MRKISALSALAALMLTACQSGGTVEPIKIGLVTALTGDVASVGNDVFKGAQLKLKEINDAGGINGRQVELVAEDGKCTGVDGASAVQKLINVDKVVAIHGAGCSGESLAAASIAEAAHVVMMSPSSSSPDLTQAGDYFFRTFPNDALKTTVMAKYFQDSGLSKVAIITENVDYAVGFRDSLEKDIGTGAFVFDERVEPGTKDFRTLVTRLKDIDFDIIVTNFTSPSAVGLLLQQLREQGLTQQAIGHDIADTQETIDAGQEAAEGLRVINVPSIAADTDFGQQFIAAYGQPQASLSWASYGYDTLGVLAEAIAAAGTEGEAIRDYLYNMESYDGVVGHISFDENGDVQGVRYALKEVKDGAFVTIGDVAVN